MASTVITDLSAFVRAALLLSLPILAGCTLGPDFHEPQPPPAMRSFAGAGGGKSPPTSRTVNDPVDPQWWAVFHDPELTALEQRVASSNLDVRLATIRLAESRQQRKITTASAFPQVQGTGSYTRTRLSPRGEFGLIGGGGSGGGSGGGATDSAGSGAGGGSGGGAAMGLPVSAGGSGLADSIREPFNLWQYGFDASWELDLWGRVRRSIEAADATVDESAEDRRNTLVAMLAEVARDYMRLRNTQAQLAIARRNQQVAQESVTLSQDRFRAGLTTQLDVANATAQQANVLAQVPRLEQAEAVAINQLSFLLGESPGALRAELAQPRPVPPVPPRVPVGLPSELARRRPDIRRAEAQLHAATAQIGVAQASFYPSVVLSGNLTLQALRFTDLGNWDSRTYSMGPNITLPIFEGGRLKARLTLTKAEQQEAAANYQRVVLNAFHEVDNALVAYDAEQRRTTQLQAAVDQNRTALTLARQRYRQGLSDFLEVLDAERQLLAAEQQWQDSQMTVSSNLVQLYLALGGGWEYQFPVPATIPPSGSRARTGA